MNIKILACGRLGNALFRYMGTILFCIIYKIKVVQEGGLGIKKFTMSDSLYVKWLEKKISSNDLVYILKSRVISFEGYFQHDIYLKYKELLLKYMKKHGDQYILTDGNVNNVGIYKYNRQKFFIKDIINLPIGFDKKYKFVIHLRLEDKMQTNHHISYKFIINILRSIISNDISKNEFDINNSCIVVKKPDTELEKAYIQKINDYLFSVFNKNIIVESNSIIEDYHIMNQAEILLCSISTISWCAALLSQNIKKCYFPNWKRGEPYFDHCGVSCKKPCENTILYNMSNFDPFYNELINIWKKGGPNETEGGWAAYYYGVFSKVINENNFKNCAEVGIGYGFHAKQILENTDVEKLYLIDPMKFYPNDAFAVDVIKYGGFEKLVKNIKLHLSEYEKRYTWFRQTSLTINNSQIQDESLDAVFVDADHSYEAVSRDLPFWWKKLKKGGWLLGDDYNSCHPGTTKAVNEFSVKNNLKLSFLFKENSSQPAYPIYKFIKQ